MRIVGIIPARHKSSRFPGKPLVKLLGKEMVLWVAELCAKALGHENVYVATESTLIRDVVESHSYHALMTSDKALTGTDRICEASQQIEADVIVNIQGDEPLLDPPDIGRFVDEKLRTPGMVINGMCRLSPNEDPESVNIPKVLTNEAGMMVYMSRRALPGFKSPENRPTTYWKQVCIYVFSKEELLAFGRFGRKGSLEHSEDIEILRFLDLGISVRMVETKGGTYAVDVPDDVPIVEGALQRKLHGDRFIS